MIAQPLEDTATAESSAAAERGTVETCVRRVYRLLDDHVESVGGMESAAGICGIDRGDLRRSFDRKNRYLALDHAVALAARMRKHNAGIATQIASALVLPMDLLVFPRVTLTAEEELKRVKRLLLSMPMGDQLYAKAVETP